MADVGGRVHRSGRETGGTFQRSLGPIALLSFTLSALSPSVSVFITGNELLRMAGTGAAPAVLIGAIIAIIAALIYAEVADSFPHAGGLYAAVERLLGGWASFIILVLALVTAPAFLAFSALGLALYCGALIPGLPTLPVAAAALIGTSCIAILRLRSSLIVASVVLILELATVVALAGAGAGHATLGLGLAVLAPVRLDPAGHLAATAPWGFMLAVVAGAFACSGVLWGSYLGEDMRGEGASFGRTLAWAGVFGALLVSIPIALTALAIADPATMLADPAPLFRFLADRLGGGIAAAVGVGVMLAIFNNLLTMTVALARLLLATGRDRMWPAPVSRLLTRIGPRSTMPICATVLLTIVALPMLLLGARALLILLSAETISPLLIAIAILVGRRRGLIPPGRFRAPLHPLLPLLGIVIISLFIVADWNDPGTGRPGVLLLAAIVALATLYYFARMRRVSDSD